MYGAPAAPRGNPDLGTLGCESEPGNFGDGANANVPIARQEKYSGIQATLGYQSFAHARLAILSQSFCA
jgi:hypothetical protein